MTPKFTIAVLGIGGVGGYIGGTLAAHYSGSKGINVVFIARGENEKVIKTNGLTLITSQGEQKVRPSFITSRPDQKNTGIVDLLLCCVKSYDLETSLESIKNCVASKTIILPFVNGVDASERIRKIFPQSEVWEGCVYIVSRLIAPGVVKESGPINHLYFGSNHTTKESLERIKMIFVTAGTDALVSENILQTMWEKFLFISPFATLTSYLDLSAGGIINNPHYRELLIQLFTELKNIADAKKIALSANIIQKLVERVESLPPETTSSMHNDFQKGGRTEVNSLTAYVVALGNELHIPTPCYEKMLTGLQEKSMTHT